jgi:hypothetical protein
MPTEDLLTRIENQQWKFAKTYAKTAPHEYIVDGWNIELFNEICHLIDTDGYEEMFYDKPFIYYNIGEFKYWHYDTILNRCAIHKSSTVEQTLKNQLNLSCNRC